MRDHTEKGRREKVEFNPDVAIFSILKEFGLYFVSRFLDHR